MSLINLTPFGTIIGSVGSYLNGPATTKYAAFDGNVNTFFDYTGADGYVGLSFEFDCIFRELRMAPRLDYGWARVYYTPIVMSDIGFDAGTVTQVGTVAYDPWRTYPPLAIIPLTPKVGKAIWLPFLGYTYGNFSEIEIWGERASNAILFQMGQPI